MVLILKSSVITSNTALPIIRRDPILDGDNGGVRFMFDTAFPWCVPAAAPVGGMAVRDMAEVANGSYRVAAAQTVTYAGGGFDFSAMTVDPSEIMGGAGCLSGIYSGNQHFMVNGWFKFPSSGDWNTSTNLFTMFCATTAAAGYPSEADLVLIGQQVTGPALTFRRQTNGAGTIDQIDLSPALHYGRVAQVAFWRNAGGQGARIKSAGGTTSGSRAVGVANTGNFSAKLPRWGVAESTNNLASIPAHQAASNMRLYRGWIEDLQVSGRDPLTVLDADFAATIARGMFL